MMARQTRPWAALRRVLIAPGFVLALWAAQLLLAKLLAGPAAAAAKAGMRGGVWIDDGHRIRALAELMVDQPGIAAAISMSLATSAVLGGLFSIVAAPAIITRLAGERSLAQVCAAAGRELPAMAVQTGYALVFRAVCTGLAALPITWLGPGGLPLALVLAGFPILVLDRARVSVVLDDERRFHPMTLLRAIGHVAKRPLWWLAGSAIEAAKLSLAIGALLLVIEAGPSSVSAIWVARAAGLATLILGLWRVALAVEDQRDSSSDRPTELDGAR
jgi:hypothetical protein